MDDSGAPNAYRIPADSAEFWINLKALAAYARSDMCPPFSPSRRSLLNRLIRAHWADRVFERVPWQVREHLGIGLDDWIAQHPDSGRTSRVVIPFQRSRSGAEAEDRLFNRFPKTNRRKDHA